MAVIDLQLSPPWQDYYSALRELFKHDPEVKMEFDSDNYDIKFYVEDANKADAMAYLIPAEKAFGNVKVTTTIIPANDKLMAPEYSTDMIDIFATMFKNNPIVEEIRSVKAGVYDFNYVIFKNKVVQYFNDDLSDINGICSTLYQNIAADIFSDAHKVFFCTALDPNDPITPPEK